MDGGQTTCSRRNRFRVVPTNRWQFSHETGTMAKDTFRVVTRGADGKLHIRDYNRQESLMRMHTQIGVDDCSTDLALRGLPVFRGLIGPMPEGKNVIRYETPEVFETLTKEWSASKSSRRKTARPTPVIEVAEVSGDAN